MFRVPKQVKFRMWLIPIQKPDLFPFSLLNKSSSCFLNIISTLCIFKSLESCLGAEEHSKQLQAITFTPHLKQSYFLPSSNQTQLEQQNDF